MTGRRAVVVADDLGRAVELAWPVDPGQLQCGRSGDRRVRVEQHHQGRDVADRRDERRRW